MSKKTLSFSDKMLPHESHGRFYNVPNESAHHVLIPSIYMYLRSLWSRIAARESVCGDWLKKRPVQHGSTEPRVTWVGHATFLIQIGGLNIVTDPLFGNPSVLFPRIMEPGISLEGLPFIDAVLLSHNHRDHMSEPCLRFLESTFQPDIFVPRNLAPWFHARAMFGVREFMWWQRVELAAKDGSGGVVEITFLPAQHWSQRGLFDRNKTLWGSWMVAYNGYTIYFGGDSAYGPHFKQIGHEFGSIDMALLPIGPCQPYELLKHSHISSAEVVQAAADLNARDVVPMHWGTFHFGTDAFYTPVEFLQRAWQTQPALVQGRTLRLAKFGEPLVGTLPLELSSRLATARPELVEGFEPL
jgi:L-ascorbate metabolism protein UlaG (beta-lactamase superfamily)